MNMSIRVLCYTPAGELRSVSHKLAMKLLSRADQPRIPEFVGASGRFAELVVTLDNRRPVSVVRASYYLLRFNADGTPDSARLGRQMIAALDMSWTISGARSEPNQTVVNREHEFVRRGARWTPTPAQVKQLQAAALSQIKVRRLA